MIAERCIVHVVDDDASWRKSVERLLSVAGYGVALYESAEMFLATAEVHALGCILLDLRMSGRSGLELQQRLAEMRHALPIIFVSGHGDIPISVLAMKAGAENFLTKPVATEVLLDAVARAVARDRSHRAGHEQLEAFRSRVGDLTPTERKVLDLVLSGKLNKQIGLELGMTERTVKWHRHNLMPKLHMESVAELVSMAERLGLIGGSSKAQT